MPSCTTPRSSTAPATSGASADRVECLRRIAATGNYELAGPITFTVYGDEFTID